MSGLRPQQAPSRLYSLPGLPLQQLNVLGLDSTVALFQYHQIPRITKSFVTDTNLSWGLTARTAALLNFSPGTRPKAVLFPFSSGHGLFCPAEALIRGASTQLEENTHEVAVFEKPEDFVTVEESADDKERHYRAESVVMDKVLKSIKRRLLASGEIRPEFLYNMKSSIKDIQKIYRAKDSSNAPNALIKTNVFFGLQLLVESYKSFMCSIDTFKMVNCRIQMLKFAQDVKNTLAKMRKLRPFI